MKIYQNINEINLNDLSIGNIFYIKNKHLIESFELISIDNDIYLFQNISDNMCEKICLIYCLLFNKKLYIVNKDINYNNKYDYKDTISNNFNYIFKSNEFINFIKQSDNDVLYIKKEDNICCNLCSIVKLNCEKCYFILIFNKEFEKNFKHINDYIFYTIIPKNNVDFLNFNYNIYYITLSLYKNIIQCLCDNSKDIQFFKLKGFFNIMKSLNIYKDLGDKKYNYMQNILLKKYNINFNITDFFKNEDKKYSISCKYLNNRINIYNNGKLINIEKQNLMNKAIIINYLNTKYSFKYKCDKFLINPFNKEVIDKKCHIVYKEYDSLILVYLFKMLTYKKFLDIYMLSENEEYNKQVKDRYKLITDLNKTFTS